MNTSIFRGGLIPIIRQCCCLLLYLNLHWFNNNLLFIAGINIGIFAALLKCFCFGEPACTGYGGGERAESADVVPADPQVTGCSGGGGRGSLASGAGEGTCRSGTESRGNPWWGRLKIIGVHLVLLEPQVVLYWQCKSLVSWSIIDLYQRFFFLGVLYWSYRMLSNLTAEA